MGLAQAGFGVKRRFSDPSLPESHSRNRQMIQLAHTRDTIAAEGDLQPKSELLVSEGALCHSFRDLDTIDDRCVTERGEADLDPKEARSRLHGRPAGGNSCVTTAGTPSELFSAVCCFRRMKTMNFGGHPIMGRDTPSDPKRKRHTTVDYRQMEIDDLAAVFHLGEKLFTARRVPNLYRTWDEFEVVSSFQSDSEYCLVAEHEGDIVAFALGTTITKSRSAWKYGHLIWLGVDPDFQQEGIAEKLFQLFRDVMVEDGVRILLVDSEADNLPALHFFRKMGFGNPQEHIYLTLNLTTHRKPHKE